MKKYVINKKEYDAPIYFEAKKIKSAYDKKRNERKKATFIVLDSKFIKKLNKISLEQGIPYQVLINKFIKEGLKKNKNI